MHKTRREVLDEIVNFFGESGDDDALTMAEGALNRAITAIWLKHPWRQFQSPVPIQVTLTVNQARYALPDYFGRVGPGKIRNLSRGGAPVEVLPDGYMDEFFETQGTSYESPSLPYVATIKGVCGVSVQPVSTGEALQVVSDAAADGSSVVCAIAGEDATGRWTRNQVPLNGTTPVAIGTWAFVDEFAKAYLSTATPTTPFTSSAGTITLSKVSGGTVLQTLFTQESAKEHPILTVFPKPTAADVLAIPVLRRPKRLFHDADPIPDLWEPAVWEELAIEWQVSAGEMTVAESLALPRPKFLDLVAFDNASRARGVTRPYHR